MKRYQFVVLLLLTAICLSSCESRREKKAIKICQSTKVEWGDLLGYDDESILGDLFGNLILKNIMKAKGINIETATWLDYANFIAAQEPDKHMAWTAKKLDRENMYEVHFLDEEGWGFFWEVDIEEKIVRFVNGNDKMSRDYGHSRYDKEAPFEVKDIVEASVEYKEGEVYGEKEGVVCTFQGVIVNHTGRALSSAKLKGGLQVIFENKTVEGEISWKSDGLAREVSESDPWYDGEEISFVVETERIRKIYLEYEPQYVFFTLGIRVSDPVGYSYDKDVWEKDLKDRWNEMRSKRNSQAIEVDVEQE